ncbi:3-deoxy-D-manno-oct-2-ulosonic acid (Kdo) hydroxylase [Chromobacterium phragmitis]|uniref:3-deoxy-D-manno-oct-2-ulosonic acid (Kdo) hydroxylase n=1 Tax=Chromobacterium phragmitis TaxID=2202141 RepID=A0A344UMY7_9NEIS|nr:Kdo hydroxylase family protein [Chromobacterium phragmitis]AXE31250.1 3-deoxy-D-manno-oct-2-ulosonic acid (Kdo) hydroxylase [Chromobacterium phragmitis]AXE36635.1 3-deoxy-D-manno-oct-2-ulosonic acid (Kdo) hydroxylase [Chromobacterium phragmitis]
MERIVNVAQGASGLVGKLEAGSVLHVPDFGFSLSAAEQALLNPAIADPKRKNISLEPGNGALHGVLGGDDAQRAVRALISRYQQAAADLLARVLPEYQGKTRAAPTSLRLVRVEDRKTSWRKDDSRLHVDAFPSRPTYGERILRVFCNINPAGEPRVWRVGEPFEDMAEKMLPRVPRQWPGSAALLAGLKITKRKRSGYDHIMLHLHDAMKADLEYQERCPQQTVPFAPGGAWICFSDHASHAVMSGQFMLEQTLWLPLESMDDPAKSPLRQLERLTGRALV